MMRRRARAALFPYTTLFRSGHTEGGVCEVGAVHIIHDIEEEEKRKQSQGDVMARSVHNLDRRRRHRARGICTHSAYLCSFYTATVAGECWFPDRTRKAPSGQLVLQAIREGRLTVGTEAPPPRFGRKRSVDY